MNEQGVAMAQAHAMSLTVRSIRKWNRNLISQNRMQRLDT